MAASTSTAAVPHIALPKNLPERFRPVVEAMRQSVLSDLPKMLDTTVPARKLFSHTPAFMDRYFWIEDMVSEVDHFHRTSSSAWQKATGGHQDDGSLLTLFLCVAAGAPPKTVLTERSAKTLVRKIRKTGIQPESVGPYIQSHAPEAHQDDYTNLWNHFIEEALPTLQTDHDHALTDAMALLRRECHVTG